MGPGKRGGSKTTAQRKKEQKKKERAVRLKKAALMASKTAPLGTSGEHWILDLNEWHERMERAEALVDAGRFDEAYQEYQELIAITPEKSPMYPDVLFSLGSTYLAAKQLPHAEKLLQAAVEREPNRPEFMCNLATCTMEQGFGHRALKLYRQCLHMDPEPEIKEFCTRQVTLLETYIKERVESLPGMTVEKREELENTFFRGVEAMERNDWTEGEHIFRRCIELNDQHHKSWGNLGLMLSMQGRTEEARAALLKALELNPGYAPAKHNLANLDAGPASPGTPAAMVTAYGNTILPSTARDLP